MQVELSRINVDLESGTRLGHWQRAGRQGGTPPVPRFEPETPFAARTAFGRFTACLLHLERLFQVI